MTYLSRTLRTVRPLAKRHNADTPNKPESGLKPLFDLLAGSWQLALLLAIASVASGLAEAGILAVVAQVAATLATDVEMADADLGPIQVHSSVTTLLAVGGALAVVRLVLQLPVSYIPAKLSSGVQGRLRTRLFAAFSRASWAEQSRDRDGDFQELMTSQVNHAISAASQAALLMTAMLAFLTLVATALALQAQAAAIVVVVSLVLFMALRPLTALGVKQSRGFSSAEMALANGVSEANRLAEETQVFGVAAAQRERISVLVDESQATLFRMQGISRLAGNIYQSLIYLLLVVGLFFVHLFADGKVAALGAVFLLLLRAGAYGNQVQTYYQQLRQSLPFVERLRSAEKRYGESAPRRGEKPLPAIRTIAFDDVSFAYEGGVPALKGVSFDIRAGEAIGVVGPSGAGKSTLAQLLLQLRVPTHGRYLVNGEPSALFAPEDWQRQVAYVPQAPHLIHATVADNIAYYRDLPQEEIELAARLARIEGDILSWREGYATRVGPRADAVSGGQAQRLCLARALAGRPEVLLLDEPTSALDPASERLIQESLVGLKGSTTLIIIAHRISTLDLCDRVMVIVGGAVDAFESLDVIGAENAYYRAAGGDVSNEPRVPKSAA